MKGLYEDVVTQMNKRRVEFFLEDEYDCEELIMEAHQPTNKILPQQDQLFRLNCKNLNPHQNNLQEQQTLRILGQWNY